MESADENAKGRREDLLLQCFMNWAETLDNLDHASS